MRLDPRPLRPRPSYANVMSTIAVFIALGGTSYAAIKLPKGSVGPTQLKADAVTSGAIRDGAITAQDLAPGAAGSGPRGPRGQSGPAGAAGVAGSPGASVTVEPWRPLTLVNGWVNYNGPAGPYANASFRKDSAGRLEVRGMVARTTAPTPGLIAVLPDGYKPARSTPLTVEMGNGAVDEAGRVDLNLDGTIIWTSGPSANANYTSLNLSVALEP